ncbi:MAG: NAD(P)/FAD-dependent oxidoreductase [Polyangiales bacterium]
MSTDPYDALIVGGGPAGLSAALILGRARKRALLVDGGTPRNAAAAHVNGFVFRDGTPPKELRRVGREQLARYPGVEVRDGLVSSIDGERGAFTARVGDDTVTARRVILCVGMIDEVPELYRALWGHAVFQCPYCHGWEIRDAAWGLVVHDPRWIEMSPFFTGWTSDLTVFTDGHFTVPDEARAALTAQGISIVERPIRALVPRDDDPTRLAFIELDDGARVAREALFAHPKQRQTPLVTAMGLALDDMGFVTVDPAGQTSRPGVYAGGDLLTMRQGALLGASAGALAAYSLNHELTMELAREGSLRRA